MTFGSERYAEQCARFIDELRTGSEHRDLRVLRHEAGLAGEPDREAFVIAVHPGNQLVSRSGPSEVERRSETATLVIPNRHDSGILSSECLHDFPGTIGRRVVDDKELPRVVRLVDNT